MLPLWMAFAFGAALLVATVTMAMVGTDASGTDAALAATARLSFLFFWPAYVGGAMAGLFGSAFQPIKRYGRELGLSFAVAHLVHIALVIWLCFIGAAPPVSVFIFFGIAAVWTYLLALFSLGRMQQLLSPKAWRLVRAVGLNYIAYAFALDFFSHPLRGSLRHLAAYLPFIFLSVVGPILRLVAFVQRNRNYLKHAFVRGG